MSSDEEALVNGRIIAEHNQVKRRYNALRAAGEQLGSAIINIGSTIKFGQGLDAQVDLSVLDIERLRAHSAEISSTRARLQELETKLSELGLQPKQSER